MPRRTGALLLLLTLAGMGSAGAQVLTGVIGAGVTSSGRHFSDPDPHALAAVTFPLHGSLGFRVEALVSGVPQGTMFAPGGDFVIGLGEEATAAQAELFS